MRGPGMQACMPRQGRAHTRRGFKFGAACHGGVAHHRQLRTDRVADVGRQRATKLQCSIRWSCCPQGYRHSSPHRSPCRHTL